MTPAYFDPLAAYLQWIVGQPLVALALPVDGAVRDFGPVTSIVIHRQAPFQTELFTARNTFQEEHRHPNVDSFEVPLFGKLYFTLNGQPVLSDADVDVCAGYGWPRDQIPPQRVRPSDWHGARVGPEGAVFLSVQLWLRGIAPSSVGLDWEGAPVSSAQEGLWTAEGRTGAPPVLPAAMSVGI
jgi:hypothetical protein